MLDRTSPGLEKVHEVPYEKSDSLGSLKEEAPRPTPGLTERTLIPGNSYHSTLMPEWMGHSIQIKEKCII